MLTAYRALDLTDEKGSLCGRILADLGVDVIKVERPGGDLSRNIGPFYKDQPHSEKSLFWFIFNANKRGITLNLETSDGKGLFKKLVERTDFIIESFHPGYMEKIGLGLPCLREINPKLTMISITPFGQTGPYRDYKATDLEVMALGGVLYVTGEPDRPPVRLSYPIAYNLASTYAAGAALIALYQRNNDGKGQHIDVSAQHAATWFLLYTRRWWELHRYVMKRPGQLRERRPGVYQHLLWPCKDGLVAFFLIGGSMGPRNNKALAQWIEEEGLADDFFKGFEWETFDWSTVSQELFDKLEGSITRFFLSHSKHELYEGAIKRRIILAPVGTIRDMAHSPQLESRKFWVNMEHPELGESLTYPGAFVKASFTPCHLRRPAPLIGEHNQNVYGEIGVTTEKLLMLKQAGVV